MKFSFWQATAIFLATTATLTAQTSASFEMGVDTNPVIGSGAIVEGDFNMDGKPDVIMAGGTNGNTQNDLVLRLGNGDGTFQPPITIGQAGGPVDMAAVDLNNDGKLDLVALTQDLGSGTGTFEVFYGNGNGTFQSPVTYATSAMPYSMAVRDLNGDGYADIAVGDDIGQVEIWNNSDGKSFVLAKEVLVNANQEHEGKVRAGQFNGNGIYSLAVANGLGVWVLWNDGKENFTSQELEGYQAPGDMNVGDLNQDGMDDIIETWGCPSTSENGAPVGCASIDVFYGQGNNKFYKNTVVSNDKGLFAPSSPWAVDVNGDGVADIVAEETYTVNSQPGLYVWLGRPDGSYDQTAEAWYPTSMAAGSLVPGDFNRDGMMDFAQTLPGSGQSEFYINGGARGPCTTSTINPTVTVCQPVNGTYLPSPVTIQADAYDKNTVTSMQEYVDGKLDYSEDVKSFDISLPMSLGQHALVTKAWDDTGLSFRSDRTINVYSGTPGPTCAAAYASASICLPSGTTTTSPVRIVANGWSAYIPTAAQLYIDGDLIVDNEGCDSEGGCYGGTSYVDTSQSLANGTHTLVFKLWDADGNEYTAQKTVTVN
jgi:FG-GAP-like repeat/Bacterial Ig domain